MKRSQSIFWALAASLLVATPVAAGLLPQSTLNHGSAAIDLLLADQVNDARPADQIFFIAQFDDQEVQPEHRTIAASLGLTWRDNLRILPHALLQGTSLQIRQLLERSEVRRLEGLREVEHDLDTATIASRAKAVWDDATAVSLGVPVIRDDDGRIIDGSGVSVAVVDTGINAHHPDLPYAIKVVRNLMPIPGKLKEPYRFDDPHNGNILGFVDTPFTSAFQAHGQHVAGIVGGLGTLSEGRFRGAAPGASLIGFGDQGAPFILTSWYRARAWEWVYENGAAQIPPVRVVTNSWGYGAGPCEPEITLSKVQQKLIAEKGIVMVFAAGNGGPDNDGTRDNVRTQPHCGPEGAIGVANYDDFDSGTRDGPLSYKSSRGLAGDPTTWPDISAPGMVVWSTASLSQRFDTDGPPGFVGDPYLVGGGTSMAAPHVAGVAALMFQANPELTPAEVECLIEQTAHKYDPDGSLTNPTQPEGPYATGYGDLRYDGSHFGRGHGLLDAYAATQAALDLLHGVLVGPAATCQNAA